jgi:hypothetical protein
VDITRQAVAKYSSKIYYALDQAVGRNDSAGIATAGTALLAAVEDADKVKLICFV